MTAPSRLPHESEGQFQKKLTRYEKNLQAQEWWEANAPEAWQEGQCPHGTLRLSDAAVVPFPARVGSTPNFLKWLVTHQSELATIHALVVEAETRYRALLKLLKEHTEPKILWTPAGFTKPAPPPSWAKTVGVSRRSYYAYTDWDTKPMPEPYRVFWGQPTNPVRTGSSEPAMTQSRLALEHGDMPHGWTLAQMCSHPWHERVEGRQGVEAMGRETWENPLQKMQYAINRVLPGLKVLNPYEPLAELFPRFGVVVLETRQLHPEATAPETLIHLRLPPHHYNDPP